MSIGLVIGCAWLAVCVASASATPAWLPPQDISGLNQSITVPKVAVNPAGDAIGIWPRDIGGERIIEVVERPAGGDWSDPIPISNLSEEDEPSEAHIGLDAVGNAVALWHASGNLGNDVIRTAVRPAGGGWFDPEDLFVEGGRTPHFAMNAAGDAVAVWTGFDGVDDEVTWVSVRPAGGDWSPPEELSVAGENDGFNPRVAIDAAGTAIAVWQRFDLPNDVVQAAVRPAGGDWSAPDTISAAGEDARSPRIAMNATGTAIAAWTVLSGGGIMAAFRPAAGDWSAPEDVAAEGVEPALAVDATGTAFALWPGPGSTENVLRVAVLPLGGEWSPAQDLSPEAEAFQSYDLAASAEAGVIATWTRGISPTSHEIQAAQRPRGGEWLAPEDISAEGDDAGLPDLAFDALGNAVAIWGRAAESDYVFQGAGFDFSGPRLDALQIPATGTVGVPVSFMVSPLDVFSQGATSWTFGDGSQAGGNAVSHVFAAPGEYPVTVSAVDGSGNTSTQTRPIAITAPPGPAPPTPDRIAISLGLGTTTLSQLLRSGKLTVFARVNRPALVTLRGKARIRVPTRGKPQTKRLKIFKAKIVQITEAGEQKMRLTLSESGRTQLRSLPAARVVIAASALAADQVARDRLAQTLRR